MLKMEIRLDENKMQIEQKHKADSIYIALDKAFAKYQFSKETKADGTLIFHGNGHPQDYGTFGRLITTLKDKEWFVEYLSKWLWYNSDDGEDENDFSVEDILYHYTHRESVA